MTTRRASGYQVTGWGYVGSWGGFTFVETTNARIYASAGASGADVYANLCVARDSYAITELGPEGLQTYYQPRGSSGAISDPLHQVGSIGRDNSQSKTSIDYWEGLRAA